MRTYVLYYDGFAGFEIIIAVANLASKGDIISFALEQRPYTSEEKLTFLPDCLAAEIDPMDVDVLLIPGGNIVPIILDPDLHQLVNSVYNAGKIIGAICGRTLLPGEVGILDGKRFTGAARDYEFDDKTLERYFKRAIYTGEDVVVDSNIITAMGQAFVEFGVEIADNAGVYGSPEERENDYKWIKNYLCSD